MYYILYIMYYYILIIMYYFFYLFFFFLQRIKNNRLIDYINITFNTLNLKVYTLIFFDFYDYLACL